MSYTPTEWVDDVTALGPTHMNKLELGLQDAADVADDALTAANAAVPKSTVTAAGDLIIATGSGAVTRLAVGAAGTVLAGGAAPAYMTPPGYEFAYADITASVPVNATTDAASSTVITLPLVTLDGSTRVCVEFEGVSALNASAERAYVSLFDSLNGGAATDLGRMWDSVGVASAAAPPAGKRFFTPASGTHVFSIRAHRDSADWTFGAGAGGVATNLPAWARVTKA